MTIREALRLGTQTLAAVPDPGLDTAALLCRAVGLPRMELYLRAQELVAPEAEAAFRALLARRAAREPLQYILGTQGFFGLELAVDPRALIPRQETETLCERALDLTRDTPAPRMLDLCTGSGAIALALKRERPDADVSAADCSADALNVARANAAALGIGVRFLHGDLFAAVAGEAFDLIVSNPPYVESAACDALQPEVRREPHLALDGGPDGLSFYRRIAREAADHLHPGGALCLEIGDTQAEQVRALLEHERRYVDIAVHRDLYGLERVVTARVPRRAAERVEAFPT